MMMMMMMIIIIIIILKYKDLTIEIQRMWNVKTKVIPVIIGATGTISMSFRKYVSVIYMVTLYTWSRYIHGTNHSTHCEPSGIPNAHSHIVKN